eukprot:353900-Chlamydomonas_euryale.AAC.1
MQPTHMVNITHCVTDNVGHYALLVLQTRLLKGRPLTSSAPAVVPPPTDHLRNTNMDNPHSTKGLIRAHLQYPAEETVPWRHPARDGRSESDPRPAHG